MLSSQPSDAYEHQNLACGRDAGLRRLCRPLALNWGHVERLLTRTTHTIPILARGTPRLRCQGRARPGHGGGRAVRAESIVGPEASGAVRSGRRRQQREREGSSIAWASAVSAALDDTQLAEAVQRLTRPLPGLGRRSAPAACAALVRWAQAVAAAHPGHRLDTTLPAALAACPTPDDVPDDPIDVAPPAPCPTAGDLFGRVAALLDHDRRRAASTSRELSV